MKKELLRIMDASKTADSMELLKNFYLVVLECEITLIIGASVLEMNSIVELLSGQTDFSSGEIFFHGKKRNCTGNMQFLRHEIVTINGIDGLVESVSITDNFFICNDGRQPFFARDKKNQQILSELLTAFGIEIDLTRPVGMLSFLQRYQLQILKWYYSGIKMILLDKRRILLSEKEFLTLCVLLDKLKRRGMTFLIADYTANSFWEGIDSIVVIKEAYTVWHGNAKLMSENKKKAILVKDVPVESVNFQLWNQRAVAMSLQNVSANCLRNVTMQLHEGEIAAIYYENYETQQELYHILNGSWAVCQGEIYIHHARSTGSNQERRAAEGVYCIEDYAFSGYLFENFTALENYCFPKGLKFRRLWYGARYKKHLKKMLNSCVKRDITALHPQYLLPEEIIKVKFRAQLLARPAVLVCQNPFSSVDQFLRKEVENLLEQLAGQGCGIILFSRLDEIRKKCQYTQYRLTGDGRLLAEYRKKDGSPFPKEERESRFEEAPPSRDPPE